MRGCFLVGIGMLVSLLCGSLAGAASDLAPVTTMQPKPVRAWHFVLRGVPLDRAHWMVDQAEKAEFNTIVIQIADAVNLRQAPWRSRPDAWSREELKGWVGYARSKGMKVIPEIKLLTHQEKFFQNNRPALMFNKSTYDPKNEAVYAQVALVLDEIIEITQTHALHIGHDEVAGHRPHSARKWLRKGERILPADLFLQDVLRLHGDLKQRGIETWMWGDMLIAPNEFPEMKHNSLHGAVESYGKFLRDKLPRDIVICDWHYVDEQANFPSLAVFKSEGFRVLGAPWERTANIRNFSRYSAAHGAEGMIATLWVHVQRKNWDVVARILRESGETFRKDFPGAK